MIEVHSCNATFDLGWDSIYCFNVCSVKIRIAYFSAKIHFFIETAKKNRDFLSKRRKGKYMRAIKDEIWVSSSFLKQDMQDCSSNKKLMVGDDYLLNLSVCCFSRLTSQ